MAIVQISRIQVRRGQENITGMPQLEGGEMGWAVDTQNLYIGNGTVAEGAPEVGNTRILTENDIALFGSTSTLYQSTLGTTPGTTLLSLTHNGADQRIDMQYSVRWDTAGILRKGDLLINAGTTTAGSTATVTDSYTYNGSTDGGLEFYTILDIGSNTVQLKYNNTVANGVISYKYSQLI